MRLIFCLGGNQKYPAMARSAGWHIGARLPCTMYPEYQPLAFADQNWRQFHNLNFNDPAYQQRLNQYCAFVAMHRPRMASVVDWEHPGQWADIVQWCERIAPHVEYIMIIPKIPGSIDSIPATLFGRVVVLGVSVPTRHGATSCMPVEFASRCVHLLGGSVQHQIQWALTLAAQNCTIMSADGNSFHRAAGYGSYWEGSRWKNDGPRQCTTKDALQKSLESIPRTWQRIGWTIE